MIANKELELAIQRVQLMEQYLDEILTAVNEDVQNLWESEKLQEQLKSLEGYYSNGQWLEDYERDERGEFPRDLKRGVLAQDTLYDFFEEINHEGIVCNR